MSCIETLQQRYPATEMLSSRVDALADLRTLVSFYSSVDFAEETAIAHGATAAEAGERGPLAAAYVRAALDFFDQAIDSIRSDASFVSIYYSALNLLKACVAFGADFRLLSSPEHRTHGASRSTGIIQHSSLFDDKVELYPAGALALGYRTLTGLDLGRSSLTIRDAYARIPMISAEAEMTGLVAPQMLTAISVPDAHGAQVLFLDSPANYALSPTQLPFLRDHAAWSAQGERQITGPPAVSLSDARDALNPSFFFLVEQPHETDRVRTTWGRPALWFPEEFFLLLAYFHLGSLARYEPEVLARFKNTRAWPVAESLRRHGLIQTMLLFCSFARRRALILSPP